MSTKDQDQDQDALISFELGPLQPGDIVFVYDGSKRTRDRIKRLLNVAGQRVLSAVRTREQIPLSASLGRHSHVMLGLGNGLVIHADGEKVSIDIISDALKHGTDDASVFEVYRRRGLPLDQAKKITQAAVRYYDQKYRFSSYFAGSKSPNEQTSTEDNTQFCSRLVAHAYRSAGAPLSSLPDQRALPVDLYRICQSDKWVDVTSKFKADPNSSFAELRARMDQTFRGGAKSGKTILQRQYEVIRACLDVEEATTTYWLAKLKAAQIIRAGPHLLRDDFAEHIVGILAQVEALLAVASLSDLDARIMETPLNKIDENATRGIYVGLPPPVAVREMQRTRESAVICYFLLMAEIGLCAILAHLHPTEGLKKFEGVKREYVEQFADIVPTIKDLARFVEAPAQFNWIDDEAERDVYRAHFQVIVKALGAIASVREGSRRNTAS